jgi:hypothetical protein
MRAICRSQITVTDHQIKQNFEEEEGEKMTILGSPLAKRAKAGERTGSMCDLSANMAIGDRLNLNVNVK